MQIEIKTNAIQAKHFFDGLAREQVPFAMSRAVNAMAYEARDRGQRNIGRYLDLRTDWLLKKGAMPVQRSSKSQLPNIHAILAVKDEVAAMAAIGGEKKAKSGSMGVPFSNTGQGTSTRQELNPGKLTLGPSKWPGRIVKGRKAKKGKRRSAGGDPKPFLMQSKKTGRTFVAQRAGADRKPLEILYELKSSVKIPEIWPLINHTLYFVETEYDDYFERELENAINKRRR